jgi:hypothetical protein
MCSVPYIKQLLAPEIRVCGVAPGSILWPENQAKLNDEQNYSQNF